MRDSKAREEALWQAEIDEHGEQEAIRRRRLDRQTRKEAEELPTSELEAMDFEDRVGDPMLSISACLRVNRRLEWSSHIAQMLASKFQIWSFEETLDEAIKTQDGDVKGWIITNRIVVIKANKPRATRKQQSIVDFSEIEWDKVLLALADEGATDYTIKIEVSAEAEKSTRKRPADSEGPEVDERPRQRRTRTDQLLDRARIRADTLADAGNFDRALLNRWQCIDEHCRNQNGFCFVDFAGKHYNMDHIQQSLWGKAISNGDANVSIERPPTSLYNFWSDKQGSVTSLSRRSDMHEERMNAKAERVEKEDFMTKFTRFNEQQMEMRMTEAMADQLKRTNARQRAAEVLKAAEVAEAAEALKAAKAAKEAVKATEASKASKVSEPHPPSHQPWPIYSPYQALPYQPWQQPPQPSPWQQPSQSVQWQQPSSAQPPPPSLPPPPPPPPPPPQPAITAQRSSPIEESEEGEILDQFFAWKINKTSRHTLKQKLAEVRIIVDAQVWSTKDLKDMTDSSSAIYRTAIQAGVPDGMARAFKEDLKLFKTVWREARTLLELSR